MCDEGEEGGGEDLLLSNMFKLIFPPPGVTKQGRQMREEPM